jgi:D-3-phosphoglycerate dehydrogenase
VADLPSLLARSEALSLHCPLSEETRGMIGAAQFAAMPKGSLLVNAARGGIVDEAALLEAIEAGQIAAAGIDVFATEPLPVDSPLRRHPRVLASPHLAASSVRGGIAMATGAAECIVAVLAGRLPALPGAIVVPGGLRVAADAA